MLLSKKLFFIKNLNFKVILSIYDGPVPVPTRLIVALASLGEIDITFINQIKTIFNFLFDSSKFNGVTTMSHWNMVFDQY